MSARNHWTALRQRRISRRTMLGASAKAGVGAAGLALVGCGDDDEPDAGAVAAERAAAAAEEAAAAAVAAGDARAADSEAAAAVAAGAADAAADAAAAAGEASAAAGEASDAAAQAASAADAAAALAAEAAESEDAANAAAAAEAAAAAAAQAADAASAAGDAAAAAVADAAAQAAEAAAQAARDAAAAVEAGTATAEAAQAAIDEAAAAAAAAAEAAGEASAAAGQAAATAQETAEAAAETAAAAVAAAQEAAEAAGEAASAAAAAIEAGMSMAEDAEFSVPWPLDQVDLDASIVAATSEDSGGLDQARTGSAANLYSHGAIFNAAMDKDPRDGNAIPSLATPEWIDPVTIRAAVTPAPFHDGSILTAHDLVFSYQRMGGLAAYHGGGLTTDHPGGWRPNNPTRGAQSWVKNEAVDDRTWAFELPEANAAFFVVNLAGVFEVSIFSQADTERRGDLAVDTSPIGTGPYRFVSHADDEDFVYERFEEHFLPVDHPVVVSHYAHNKHLTILVRPELQSQLAGLEAGEIDMVANLGPETVKPFLDDPDFTVQFQSGTNTLHHIYPNLYAQTMDDGSPNPFLDLRVRQAANHAVNRQALIDGFLLGQGEQGLFAFSGVQGYPSPEQKREVLFDYDPDKARALLAEAGYPDGFDIPLYWTPDYGGSYIADMVLAVAQDLATVGIRTDLRSIPAGEYFTDAYTRGGPNALPGLFWFIANNVSDIGSMWDCCTGPGGFYTLSDPLDPGLHELYLAQKVEIDLDRRLEMIAELLLWHAREAYFIFIVEPPEGVLTRSDVNWPKGGRVGTLWGGTAFAAQKHI